MIRLMPGYDWPLRRTDGYRSRPMQMERVFALLMLQSGSRALYGAADVANRHWSRADRAARAINQRHQAALRAFAHSKSSCRCQGRLMTAKEALAGRQGLKWPAAVWHLYLDSARYNEAVQVLDMVTRLEAAARAKDKAVAFYYVGVEAGDMEGPGHAWGCCVAVDFSAVSDSFRPRGLRTLPLELLPVQRLPPASPCAGGSRCPSQVRSGVGTRPCGPGVQPGLGTHPNPRVPPGGAGRAAPPVRGRRRTRVRPGGLQPDARRRLKRLAVWVGLALGVTAFYHKLTGDAAVPEVAPPSVLDVAVPAFDRPFRADTRSE